MDKSKNAVLQNLHKLGYFKYVVPSDLQRVKEETFSDYQGYGAINFHTEGLNRTFGIDAEFIFEAEGILGFVNSVQNLFKAMGIELNIGEYIEEFDGNGYSKRSIEINNNVYDVSGVEDWSDAYNSGIDLMEMILADYGSTEQVYALFLDEVSSLILLDKDLFQYLHQLIPVNATFRPTELDERFE